LEPGGLATTAHPVHVGVGQHGADVAVDGVHPPDTWPDDVEPGQDVLDEILGLVVVTTQHPGGAIHQRSTRDDVLAEARPHGHPNLPSAETLAVKWNGGKRRAVGSAVARALAGLLLVGLLVGKSVRAVGK